MFGTAIRTILDTGRRYEAPAWKCRSVREEEEEECITGRKFE
jgi:hypothetical protein